MGNGDIPGEERKSHAFDSGDVADGAVGNGAHAAEYAQDVRVHLPQERALAGVLIHILDDHHTRGGHAENEIPPIRPVKVAGSIGGRRRATRPDGDSVTEHRRQMGKEAAHTSVGKALVAQADLKRLDGVGDQAGIEPAKRFEFFWWKEWRGHLRLALSIGLEVILSPAWTNPCPPMMTWSWS